MLMDLKTPLTALGPAFRMKKKLLTKLDLETVEDLLLHHVLDGLLHAEHILAEASACTLVIEAVFSNPEFIAPCKKPDTAGFFLVEIRVVHTCT